MTYEPTERIATYRRSLQQYGESPQALKWKNYRAAAQRYKQLLADLDITGKTVLDAGCGMGDLLPFLYAKGENFDYLGVDINPDFVEIARKRYAGHEFQAFDPFGDALTHQFDLIVTSGVLNAGTPGWQNQRKIMIRHLFEHASEVLAFNMAGWRQQEAEVKNIGYANVDDILAFCETLTDKIILRNHYNKQDFTIILFR